MDKVFEWVDYVLTTPLNEMPEAQAIEAAGPYIFLGFIALTALGFIGQVIKKLGGD